MMNAKIKVYDRSKYDAENVKVAEVEYRDIIGYKVERIEAAEILAAGFDETDEYNEYLILTFENGETATFRNSHVDMFRI